MEHISAQRLQAWLAGEEQQKPLLLDVREPWEFGICRIPGSVSVPLSSVAARLPELEEAMDKDSPVVVICHHGARSFQVGTFLERQGFEKVINLDGGVAAWAAEVDPAMPTY